jgi:hypothetical protein
MAIEIEARLVADEDEEHITPGGERAEGRIVKEVVRRIE